VGFTACKKVVPEYNLSKSNVEEAMGIIAPELY